MKKYTTPEVEVIKFQIQEAIASADGGSIPEVDGGATTVTAPGGGPLFPD